MTDATSTRSTALHAGSATRPPLPTPPARRRVSRQLRPLLWVGPAVALIAFVVIWPIVSMFQTSFQKISPFGLNEGSAGGENFRNLFNQPAFVGVVERSIIWVVSVVVITMLISLGLAQLFNKRFPGRRYTRWALIAPWASSVLMTAIVFRWMLTSGYGLFNVIAHDLGLVGSLNRTDPLGQASTAMPWLIFVAIFVSVPFSTYAILAGLSGIPTELYEAASVDGASKWRAYWSVTLPLLRPAIVVATLINIMNVFNNFPVIWAMTRGQPGYSTSTTTVFMYILTQSDLGQSAAMSVINFGIVVILTGIFLKVSGWKSEAE